MPRLRWFDPGHHHNSLALATLALVGITSGCVSDVELDPEDQDIDVGAVVRSVFDPTNPVEVLQLIPAPTALAQVDPTNAEGNYGSVDFEATAPAPCEGMTSASCLPLASTGGWPSGLSAELFFSDFLVESSVADGIVLLEEQDNGSFAPLAFSITSTTIEAPPGACLTDVPQEAVDAYTSNVRVEVIPDAGFKPDTRYALFATTALQGQGRIEADGTQGPPRPVEPSSLFYLLAINGADTPPPPVTVDENGRFTITGPLQAQVEANVRAALGPDAPPEVIDAAVQSSAEGLFGLQTFFRGLADLAEAGPGFEPIARADLVFANVWSTGQSRDDFQKVVFAPDTRPDPGPEGPNNQLPFPNVPLLTTATITAEGPDVINDIPSPGGSELVDRIFDGLNTLNGFGTTTPIALSTTAPIDPATTEGNVLLIPYDPSTEPATPIGGPVPVRVTGSPEPTGTDVDGRDVYSLTVQPLTPLLPDTFYVLGITSGLATSVAQDLQSFIKDDSFVTLAQTSTDAIEMIVTCGGIDPETGEFPSRGEVEQTLFAIENVLQRARWQDGFEVFENLPTPVSRDQLAIVVPYKTQDITDTLDAVDNLLLPNVYGMIPDPTGRPAVVELQLPTINPANPNPQGYVDQPPPGLPEAEIFVCSQLCQQGLLAIPGIGGSAPISPGACLDDINALLGHATCRLLASNIDEVRLFDIRHYVLTDGNPQEGGTFTPETVQTPRVARTQVWYAAGGQAPAGGRPAAIFQHGLGSNKESGLLIANSIAGANDEGGWATFVMDLPFHGSRASDIQDNETDAFCEDVDPADVSCDVDPTSPTFGACTDGCDGIQDPSGTGFLGVNVFATRDNFRQSVVDHLTLIDHIEQGRFDDFVNGSLAGDRIGYIGQSLGGITGSNTAAYAENLEATVLNTAGGSLTTILLNSIPDVSEGLLASLVQLGICTPVNPDDITEGCQSTPEFNQFILLAQTALEPGDPLATSVGVEVGLLGDRPALGTDRVLQQVALPDPVITNTSSFLLGGSFGIFDLVEQMPTSPQFQIFDLTDAPRDPVGGGCHGFLLQFGDPIGGFCGSDINDALCTTFGAQAQAAEFLDSAGMTVSSQQPTELVIDETRTISCE